MQRRILTGLLLAALTLSGGGCGRDNTSGKIQLRYMAWGNPEQLALEESLCDRFNAENPDLHVSFLKVPGSAYLNKAIVMFASRTAPDVVRIDHYNFPQLLEREYFLDMTDLASADPTFHREDYEPAAIDEGTVNGHLYGMGVLFGAILLYYNKTLFAKAGLEDPWTLYQRNEWTYERLREDAIKLTKFDEDGKPKQFGMILPTYPTNVGIIRAFGGELLNADHTKCLANEPGSVAAYRFMYGLRWKDHCTPTPSQAANAAFPFESGKVGMDFNWMGMSPRYRTNCKGFEWDVVPLPRGPAGYSTILKGNQLVIYRESKHPDAAWRFVRFMTGTSIERELYINRRRSYPTLLEVSQSPDFFATKLPPFNTHAFTDAVKFGKSLPIDSRWGEWTNAYNSEVDALFSGRSSDVRAVLNEATRKVDAVLADEAGF